MNSDLEQKLYIKYPKLFKERNLPPAHTCMSFGLECSDGWYNIIDRMCFVIQNYIDQRRASISSIKRFNRALKAAVNGNDKSLRSFYSKSGYKEEKLDEIVNTTIKRNLPRESINNEDSPKQLMYTQIKEKFGALRVYSSGGDAYCSGIIGMAESMSRSVCERCGNPGKLSGTSWLRTICDKCEQQRTTSTADS